MAIESMVTSQSKSLNDNVCFFSLSLRMYMCACVVFIRDISSLMVLSRVQILSERYTPFDKIPSRALFARTAESGRTCVRKEKNDLFFLLSFLQQELSSHDVDVRARPRIHRGCLPFIIDSTRTDFDRRATSHKMHLDDALFLDYLPFLCSRSNKDSLLTSDRKQTIVSERY